MDSAKMPQILKEIEVGKSTTTFNPDRDRERKEKLNMRKLKTLTDEYEFLSNKFRGSIPRCVRNRLSRLEDVINVKTAIYEKALKND